MFLHKLILSSILSVFCIVAAFAQASKSIHHTIDMKGMKKVNLKLIGKQIEFKETKSSRILLKITVTISSNNQRLLDFICNNGRYNLIQTVDNVAKELVLSSKKSNNQLIIKNKVCQEDVKFTIYLPKDVSYNNNSTLIGDEEE